VNENKWRLTSRAFYYAANGLIIGAVPALWLDLISARFAAAAFTLGVACVAAWLVIGWHVYRLMTARHERTIARLKAEDQR
jgi:hypothetical protein